jgi:hypothetical protein
MEQSLKKTADERNDALAMHVQAAVSRGARVGRR